MDYLYVRHSHSHSESEHDHDAHAHVCEVGNDYSGKKGLRILSIFIILISSAFGSLFPVLSSRYSFIRLPDWCFFVAKYFGSGVIVSTAFIHLLAHAASALGQSCLGGTFEDYPWDFGICMMSLFVLFFIELLSHYYIKSLTVDPKVNESISFVEKNVNIEAGNVNGDDREFINGAVDTTFSGSDSDSTLNPDASEYRNKLVSVFILEAGIIFHSVFVGLSLAVAGEEFVTLFIVLVFHQMFEGLGLGTRIAEVTWPPERRFTPWVLAGLFAITTPIAIAIGLGVRKTFAPESKTALIANGVFDSISAGILIYTGLVELVAFEFFYSKHLAKDPSMKKILLAFVIMCAGAGLMALLGKWA